MIDANMVEEIKRVYSSVKNLDAEKKSIAEDIKEEILSSAKKLNVEAKVVNAIIKLIKAKEKGDDPTEYEHIAAAVLGIDDMIKDKLGN